MCVFYIICAVNMHGERMLLHVFSLLSIGTLRGASLPEDMYTISREC